MSRLAVTLAFIGCILCSTAIADSSKAEKEMIEKEVLADGLLLGKDDYGTEYGLAYDKILKRPIIEVKTKDGDVYTVDVDALPKEELELEALAKTEEKTVKRDVNWDNDNGAGRLKPVSRRRKRGWIRWRGVTDWVVRDGIPIIVRTL